MPLSALPATNLNIQVPITKTVNTIDHRLLILFVFELIVYCQEGEEDDEDIEEEQEVEGGEEEEEGDDVDNAARQVLLTLDVVVTCIVIPTKNFIVL